MIAKLEAEGQCRILRVSGRIDFESALDFEQQINSMIQQDADCFIIELSEVELLSSAGLRVLLSTAKRVSHRDASLGLAAPSQVVRQVFEISHFNLLFKIFPSVSAAIAALKGQTHAAEPVASREASSGDSENAEKTPRPAIEPPPVPGPGHKAAQQRAEMEPARDVPSQVPLTSASPPDQRAPVDAPVRPSLQPQAPVPEAAPPIPSRPPPVSPAPPPPAPAARQLTPPPLPAAQKAPPSLESGKDRSSKPTPATPGAETVIPVARPAQQPPVQKPSTPPPRVEVSHAAQLEVRAEGNIYPCKDGDVIGSAGQLGKGYFAQIPGLAPRHLLIGKMEGRWFVFTPQNVQHPFSCDGQPLVAGERKFLRYADHQMEFNGRVFAFRLVPERKKQGFFSRVFGKK
jgi:anti-anti-sigma factor